MSAPVDSASERAAVRLVAAGRWSVVSEDSQARFSVRDKLVTTVRGSLPVEGGGAVVGDGGEVAEAWVSLSVPGISTGNGRRDRDLRTPRFLDAPGSPVVRVEVEDATPTATGWTARASVHARGRRAPVDLTVEAVARSGEHARVRVTGRLDRLPLGMRAPTFVVGRFVDLEVDVAFRRVDPSGARAE